MSTKEIDKKEENIDVQKTETNIKDSGSEASFAKFKRNDKKDKWNKKSKEEKEFLEKLVEVRKVTNVTTGGRKMSFRATVLVGNKNGKIGLGVGKGIDVSIAVKKATNDAYKNIKTVLITNEGSVLYPLLGKKKSCSVKILPAANGTGIKAGSSVRQVLEIAGYKNIISKILGSNNKLNNITACLEALYGMKLKPSHVRFVSNQNDVEKELIEKRKQTSEQNSFKKKPFSKGNFSREQNKNNLEKPKENKPEENKPEPSEKIVKKTKPKETKKVEVPKKA